MKFSHTYKKQNNVTSRNITIYNLVFNTLHLKIANTVLNSRLKQQQHDLEIIWTDEGFRLLWYLSGDSESISPFLLKHLYAYQQRNLYKQSWNAKSMSVKMSQFRHTCYPLPSHIVMMIPILHYNEYLKTIHPEFIVMI